MTATKESLRQDARDLFQNLGASALPDATLDLCIRKALWRLSRDRPDLGNYSLAATGVKHSLTALVADWVPDFSVVRQVYLPAPTTDMINVDPLDNTGYKQVTIGAVDYIYIHVGVGDGGALLVYTRPWLVSEVNGAVTTTLASSLEVAMGWMTGHMVALAMAGKSAGASDKSAPADFINFRSKGDDYRRVAAEYEKEYFKEMGIANAGPAPISAVRTIPSRNQDSGGFMTHRTSRIR